MAHSVYKISSLYNVSNATQRQWIVVGVYEDGDLVSQENSIFIKGLPSKLQFAGYTERLRVVTVEEKPFVIVDVIDESATEHSCQNGLICLKASSSDKKHIKRLFRQFHSNKTSVQRYCCFGISVTILKQLSNDLNLQFDLYIAADGKYGVLQNDGNWNGVVQDIVSGAADIAIGALSVNGSRLRVMDFSVPFSYSGLNLILGQLERMTMYTAFLRPLHWSMWVGIFVALNAVALATTFYEWQSPYGLTPRGRNRRKVFGFPSALTMTWSVLFSHTVTTKSPKCWSSRWLINVWALFSIVFIASYTANLAAFMVGDHSYDHLSGIEDRRVILY